MSLQRWLPSISKRVKILLVIASFRILKGTLCNLKFFVFLRILWTYNCNFIITLRALIDFNSIVDGLSEPSQYFTNNLNKKCIFLEWFLFLTIIKCKVCWCVCNGNNQLIYEIAMTFFLIFKIIVEFVLRVNFCVKIKLFLRKDNFIILVQN